MKADKARGQQYPAYGAPARAESLMDRIKARKKPLAITVLLVGGLAFAAGWNPPTTTVHSFTESSEYSARRESGCTNSGEGCHGSDETLADFNKYHPEAECTTCHDYTGVGCIPCHKPNQTECTGCHDGSMDGISDCVRLTDSFPKGHYRESLHTAMGTDMQKVVLAVESGTAKASCANCHARDLKAAHTGVPVVEGSELGADIGCYECHNDEKSGSLDQVLNDWKKHRCEDCHGEKSLAPMHSADIATAAEGTGEAGCGETGAGCHVGNNIHALHPNAPATCSGSAAEGEPACHNFELQSAEATVTACGTGESTCHTPYRNDEYGHKNDAKLHAPKSSAQGVAKLTDPITGIVLTCGSCHSMDLSVEHARLGADACDECHNKNETTIRAVKDSWPGRDTQRACAACHGSQQHGDFGASHIAKQFDDSGKASTSACSKSGCHSTADVRTLHSAVGCMISGCHSSSGGIDGAGIMSCGGTAAQAGRSCHTGGVHANAQASHIATQLDKDGKPSATACLGSACHSTADTRVLHVQVGCGVTGCHSATGGAPATKIMTCGGTDAQSGISCHTGTSVHATLDAKHNATEIADSGTPTPGACVRSGCHATTDVRVLHVATNGCFTIGCHGNAGTTYMSCGGTADTPSSCHTSARHATFTTAHQANPQPDANACGRPGCHPTLVLSELHAAKGCNITGCHVTTGTVPIAKTCGGSDLSGNCHVESTQHIYMPQRHAAIELNTSGTAQPGACYCHFRAGTDATDVRSVRISVAPATPTAVPAHGCIATPGCHLASGPYSATCGGPNAAVGCHSGGTIGRLPSAACVIPAPAVASEVVWRVSHATEPTAPIAAPESAPDSVTPAPEPVGEQPTVDVGQQDTVGAAPPDTEMPALEESATTAPGEVPTVTTP